MYKMEARETSKRKSWGGKRSKSGRIRVDPSQRFKQRTIRLYLYQEDRDKWNSLKLSAGKTSDPQFCKYLLELAEAALDNS